MQQPAQQSIAGLPPTPPCIDTAYRKADPQTARAAAFVSGKA